MMNQNFQEKLDEKDDPAFSKKINVNHDFLGKFKMNQHFHYDNSG